LRRSKKAHRVRISQKDGEILVSSEERGMESYWSHQRSGGWRVTGLIRGEGDGELLVSSEERGVGRVQLGGEPN